MNASAIALGTGRPSVPRHAVRRGTRGFAAIVISLAGFVIVSFGLAALPSSGLDPLALSWIIPLTLAFGIGHFVAAYGLIAGRSWSASLTGYLAAIGIGIAVYGLLTTLTGLDPFGATSTLPAGQARAEGLGLLVWMIGLWAVAARSALRGFRPASFPPEHDEGSALTAILGRAMTESASLYQRAGGTPFFEALVGHFYAGVAADPVLRAIYPEEDLAAAQRRLTLFLIQYWGGPTTYDDERGHPRLRMRHAPFAIGPEARDRWLVVMSAAVTELAPDPAIAAELDRYFTMAAEAMRNRE